MKKTVKKAALAKKAAHTKKSVAKEKHATKAKAVAAKAKVQSCKNQAQGEGGHRKARCKARRQEDDSDQGHRASEACQARPCGSCTCCKARARGGKARGRACGRRGQARRSAAPAAPKKLAFKIGELVVYPAHGVGKITAIEEQEIAGSKLELYIVDFEREKLRLKVPTNRAEQKGMRRLADRGLIEHAMKVIRGRARIKRTMWSRRAQEYDAKINSGDLIAVAEVVRDLYRSDRQPEQSYSERQLFEQALLRMARELAAVRKVDDDQSVKELSEFLAKNAKRAQAAGEKAEEEAAAEEAA